jgi:hypothetical protein
MSRCDNNYLKTAIATAGRCRDATTTASGRQAHVAPRHKVSLDFAVKWSVSAGDYYMPDDAH